MLFISINILAQEKEYYFYNPENNFGSDLNFNPVTLMINGSFDVLRNGGHTKEIFKRNFAHGYKNVFKNLGDPFTNIKRYGWNEFIKLEIWNFELNKNRSNFIPNLVDHTIGNGMQYAKLKEWLDYHEYPYPTLLSFLFTSTYQLTNEALENRSHKGPNIDAIADVYIFNTLGFVLFEFDFVKEFFTKILPLYDWNLQPMLTLNNRFLENSGQQYLVRKELPFVNNISGFVYWGLNGIAGLTYTHNKIHNFSLGVGQVTNRIRDNLENGLRFFAPDLDGAIAFFYDKNNSLMFSALVTGPRIPNVRINMYPGLFEIGGIKPGVYIGYGKWDDFILGINFYHQIPFGIGFKANR